METKVCRKYGRELPTENFYKNHTCKDGIDTICKECKNEYQREWQKKNREKKMALELENTEFDYGHNVKHYSED